MPKFPKGFDRDAFMRCLDSGLTADQILDTLLDLKRAEVELPVLDAPKPGLDMPETVNCSRYTGATRGISWMVESTKDSVLGVYRAIYGRPNNRLALVAYAEFEAIGGRDVQCFRLREPYGQDLLVLKDDDIYTIRYSLDFVDNQPRRQATPMPTGARNSIVRGEPAIRAFDFFEEEA